MTTTDPTKPHICTADGGPACPGHTPNCEPGCAQPAAAAPDIDQSPASSGQVSSNSWPAGQPTPATVDDSTGRPPRVDGEDIVIRDLRRQLVAARQETARVRSQLAEARAELRQARIDAMNEQIIRDLDIAGMAAERDRLRTEAAMLRTELAEAREQRDQAAEALVRAETERDEARDRLRTLIDEVWRHIGWQRCDSGDIPIRLGERYSQAVLREIDRLRTERETRRRQRAMDGAEATVHGRPAPDEPTHAVHRAKEVA